jgi:hypothetical protein
MKRLEAGEICLAGQVLDPQQATQFGNLVLSITAHYLSESNWPDHKSNFAMNLYEPSTPPDATSLDPSNSFSAIHLSRADGLFIAQAEEYFRKILAVQAPGPRSITTNLLVGPESTDGWHKDIAPDFRLLVNLSEFPVGLKIAAAENSPRDHRIAPSNYHTLTYEPGQGIDIHNACAVDRQTQHAASREDGRVILRLLA